MFPSSAAILDPLVAPVGAMNTGSWIADALGDDPMRIVAGGGAQGTNAGVSAVALWSVPVAVAASAFVTVSVLPTAPNIAVVGLIDSPQLNSQLQVALDPSTGHVILGTDAGSVPFTPGTFHNGDGIGVTYDPGSDMATAWYRPAGGAWANLGTEIGDQVRAPTSWYLFLRATDATNLRLRDFGGQTLPGSTAPVPIGGHGAC